MIDFDTPLKVNRSRAFTAVIAMIATVTLVLPAGTLYAQLPIPSNASDGTSNLTQQENNQNQINTSRPLEPPANGTFVRQGQVSSSPSTLPSYEGLQTALILEPRLESTAYSGTLTFDATRPISVISWQLIQGVNSTLLNEEFGDFSDVIAGSLGVLVPAEIASGTSGSVPFVGNALELIAEADDGQENEPFIATYTVNGFSAQPTVESDLASISQFEPPSTEGDDDVAEGDDDVAEGDDDVAEEEE
jgi:hypothetical protein